VATEPTENPAPAAEENTVEAGVYATPQEAFEHGLVVLAMGEPCWIDDGVQGHRVLVEPNRLAEIRRQLACFDRESQHWPPRPLHDPAAGRRLLVLTPLVWALVVLAAFWAEILHPSWVNLGALDSEALFVRHEWWRPVTALFLHADAGHVLSNGLNGILVFSAVVTTFGRSRGWSLLALAAVAGNVLSATINIDAPYHSIGASTAVFAGVGLLTGRAMRLVMRLPRHHRWRALFVPFAAGLTVLGLYGAGGVQIDVLAHAAGFVTGLAAGFLGAALPKVR
jgi:rhomboid protease GluP